MNSVDFKNFDSIAQRKSFGHLKITVTERDGIVYVAFQIEKSMLFVAEIFESIGGLSTHVTHNNDGGGAFVEICNESPGCRNVFCEVLFRATSIAEGQSNSKSAIKVFVEHFFEYIEFFKSPPDGLLSESAVRGLFGELTFLMMNHVNIGIESMIDGWEGPLKAPHDFLLRCKEGDTAVEIKTVMGQNTDLVTINGLEQLDHSLFYKLYLVIYRLQDGVVTGHTLPEMISQLSTLMDAALERNFCAKLIKCGYWFTAAHQYQQKFRVTETNCFLVSDETPALTRSNVPVGINTAEYGIAISSLKTKIDIGGVKWT